MACDRCDLGGHCQTVRADLLLERVLFRGTESAHVREVGRVCHRLCWAHILVKSQVLRKGRTRGLREQVSYRRDYFAARRIHLLGAGLTDCAIIQIC